MIEEIENGLGLVVDTSTPEIQIGLIEKAGWRSILKSENLALEGIFSLFERILNLEPEARNIREIFFCEGPGSTLGFVLPLHSYEFINGMQNPIQFKSSSITPWIWLSFW